MDFLELRRPQVNFWPTSMFLSFSVELLAVGGLSPNNVKTEMYLTEVGRWYTLEDYPFDLVSKNYVYKVSMTFLIHTKDSYLYFSAALYHNGFFYLFGGYSGSYSQTIARLDTKTTKWSKAG